MMAGGGNGVRGLACHFLGCLILQRPHEHLSPRNAMQTEHPGTPENSPWASGFRPPLGWPPLSCAGDLRETGIGSRTSKASGANMKGGGQCCAVSLAPGQHPCPVFQQRPHQEALRDGTEPPAALASHRSDICLQGAPCQR